MWPFTKKTKLPGIRKDRLGNLVFDLTDEEKTEIQKEIDLLKSAAGDDIAVKKEIYEEFNRAIIARGLFHYAKDQIMLSESKLNNTEKEILINKAIASITKAYSIFPLPIHMYDLACFMEMAGRNVEAKEAFKKFLELQQNFRPTQIELIYLDNQSRDIDAAIKDATEKIKE